MQTASGWWQKGHHATGTSLFWESSMNILFVPLQELYNKLYMHLATDMHTALNQLIAQTASKGHRPSAATPSRTRGSSMGPEGPSRHQLVVLKGLADEAELTGDQGAAERYHQERVLAPANPQVSPLLPPLPCLLLPLLAHSSSTCSTLNLTLCISSTCHLTASQKADTQ